MRPPEPPPEAALIRLVREAAGIKLPAAATTAGISKARWSQIECGYESRDGGYKEVHGRAVTIAHMAAAVGVTPQRLATEGGRPDAARVLEEILSQDSHSSPHGGPPPGSQHRELQAIQDTLDELQDRIRHLQERDELRFATSPAYRRRTA